MTRRGCGVAAAARALVRDTLVDGEGDGVDADDSYLDFIFACFKAGT